jgi:hypothetical protein
MTLGYTTIITPIADGQIEPLKAYLKDNANPALDPLTSGIVCRPAFRFDQIECLHFCSFVVLDEDKGAQITAQLIFEATFDGSRDDFLTELISAAPAGMRSVYQHCVGYPQCEMTVLELTKAYLITHDVGAHTFFSGSPGRTVGQIRGESRLRSEIVTYLSAWRQSSSAMPPTLAEVRERMRDDVVSQQPHNQWAREPAEVPWEVRWRDRIACAAPWALGAAAGVLGLLILYGLGLGPDGLAEHIQRVRNWSDWAGEALVRIGWRGPVLPVLYGLIALIVAWFVVRIFELLLRSSMVDPRKEFLRRRYVLHLLWITRHALLGLLIASAALAILAVGEQAKPSSGAKAAPADAMSETAAAEVWQYRKVIGQLDKSVGRTAPAATQPADTPPSRLASALLAILALAGLALLRHAATSLKLAVELKQLTPTGENMRRYLLDIVRFCSVVLALVFLFALVRHLDGDWQRYLAGYGTPLVWLLMLIGVCVLVGVLAFDLVLLLAFLVVRALEVLDRWRYEPATRLNERAFDKPEARVREEGGINLYQNHLASLTYVKGGLLRRFLLRSTLFIINVLSRFYFNQGTLGDIPTILSARWVMIDGGRRLIFLDNYGGGWESYLNEFIDLSAVRGLNAIWTNTFIKATIPAPGMPVRAGAAVDGPESCYAFPATRFYLWEGAQVERPFKAYVRTSQVETIAWYGAYHTLSITNINSNTHLRQSLFKPMASCDLDKMFQQL